MAQALFIAAVIPRRYGATWAADKIGSDCLSLLADEGCCLSIDGSLCSWLRNKAGLTRGFHCAEEIGKARFPVVTHPESLMSQHLLLLFSWLLFIPTSCSDELKKFLTPDIAFQHCSFWLLTGVTTFFFFFFPSSLARCVLGKMLTHDTKTSVHVPQDPAGMQV